MAFPICVSSGCAEEGTSLAGKIENAWCLAARNTRRCPGRFRDDRKGGGWLCSQESRHWGDVLVTFSYSERVSVWFPARSALLIQQYGEILFLFFFFKLWEAHSVFDSPNWRDLRE